MADQRLPIVNSDDGAWGTLLNQYLEKEHYNTGLNDAANGGHKTVTVRAGTAAAGTAPLKFTSGVLLTAPEPGAIEFSASKLYFTDSTPTRHTIATYNDASGVEGDIYYRNASGELVRLPRTTNGDILELASGVPSWQTPGTAINVNMSVGTTAPGSPAINDVWVDTN